MSKLRILYADDAAIYRRLVADELSADPELETVTAPTGKVALAKFDQSPPDLVLLDVEMPDMDGLETLQAIRARSATTPVIMFSALTERGAGVTLDALSMGATDYFTKPSNLGGLDASLAVIRTKLIPVIKTLCRRAQPAQAPCWPTACKAAEPAARSSPVIGLPRPTAGHEPPPVAEVVCIGSSTGGPNALASVMRGMPIRPSAPILIVQHMPAVFTKTLAERLTSVSGLDVQEAVSGRAIEPGQVWVAPGDFHMIIVRDGSIPRLLLHQDAQVNYSRPSVDVLFRSAARSYGPTALGVVLTGMGNEGERGCGEIKAAGGQVLVQDEATSVVWGMPGCVANAGLADRVIPLELISAEIKERLRLPGRRFMSREWPSVANDTPPSPTIPIR